jgi:riboflavin-specific deaminase-like protein
MKPFVTLKFAQTLDGRIATATGESKWISGPEARKFAHELRSKNDAVLVGIGTILADDPRLTVRLVEGRDPIRVVVDSRLRIPTRASVLRDGAARGTIVATTPGADQNRKAEIERLGAEVMVVESDRADQSRVDLKRLIAELGARGLSSILVEGGAGIITSLLAQRLVDRLVVAVAPKIIGRGFDAVGDLAISGLGDAVTFSSVETCRLGDDFIFDCLLGYGTQE